MLTFFFLFLKKGNFIPKLNDKSNICIGDGLGLYLFYSKKKKKKACLGPLLQGPKHLIGKKVKPGSLSSKVAINL